MRTKVRKRNPKTKMTIRTINNKVKIEIYIIKLDAEGSFGVFLIDFSKIW